MNNRFFLIIVSILLFIACPTKAQNIVYLTDRPGKIFQGNTHSIKAFNTAGILEVTNKISMISHPIGYDVKESQSAFNWPGRKSTNGSVILGFPSWYRINNGPEQRQVEFPLIQFIVNNLMDLTNESYFLADETDKAKLPQMFTDTIAFKYETRNSQPIGISTNIQGYRYIMINPKNKPCFIPVTKEQMIKLWVSKLNAELDKYKTLIADNYRFLNSQKAGNANAALITQLQKTDKSYSLWLEYLFGKKKQYTEKLASLSPTEKKEPAEYGTPAKIAALTNRDGSLVNKVTGDMNYELTDMMSGENIKKGHIFTYNPNFFDPALTKTSIQIILIKDATKIGFGKEDRIQRLLDKEFYPVLDYKSLASLMNK